VQKIENIFLTIYSFKKIVIFVLSAQNDCFLLGHENEFLVETVRSRLQTHSNTIVIWITSPENDVLRV
jgi:hypothetical protein